MQGPFKLHPSTPGGQALIEDTQGKLAELLEEESLEDASLSEFLAVLLSRAPDRATVEAELVELLQDLAPILLDWVYERLSTHPERYHLHDTPDAGTDEDGGEEEQRTQDPAGATGEEQGDGDEAAAAATTAAAAVDAVAADGGSEALTRGANGAAVDGAEARAEAAAGDRSSRRHRPIVFDPPPAGEPSGVGGPAPPAAAADPRPQAPHWAPAAPLAQDRTRIDRSHIGRLKSALGQTEPRAAHVSGAKRRASSPPQGERPASAPLRVAGTGVARGEAPARPARRPGGLTMFAAALQEAKASVQVADTQVTIAMQTYLQGVRERKKRAAAEAAAAEAAAAEAAAAEAATAAAAAAAAAAAEAQRASRARRDAPPAAPRTGRGEAAPPHKARAKTKAVARVAAEQQQEQQQQQAQQHKQPQPQPPTKQPVFARLGSKEPPPAGPPPAAAEPPKRDVFARLGGGGGVGAAAAPASTASAAAADTAPRKAAAGVKRAAANGAAAAAQRAPLHAVVAGPEGPEAQRPTKAARTAAASSPAQASAQAPKRAGGGAAAKRSRAPTQAAKDGQRAPSDDAAPPTAPPPRTAARGAAAAAAQDAGAAKPAAGAAARAAKAKTARPGGGGAGNAAAAATATAATAPGGAGAPGDKSQRLAEMRREMERVQREIQSLKRGVTGAAPPDSECCVVVTNLPPGTSADAVGAHFAACGAVRGVTLAGAHAFAPRTATVEFEAAAAVEGALRRTGSMLAGSLIVVARRPAGAKPQGRLPASTPQGPSRQRGPDADSPSSQELLV